MYVNYKETLNTMSPASEEKPLACDLRSEEKAVPQSPINISHQPAANDVTPNERPQPKQSRARWVTAAYGLTIGFLGAASVWSLHAVRHARAQWGPEKDVYYLPQSSALKAASLGHSEALSSLVVARTNVYFGTQIAQRKNNKWLETYLNTAADLDPYFQKLYVGGSAMLVYYGGTISVEAVEAANRYLKRGLTVFPNDWKMWFQLGFNQVFELRNASEKDDPRRLAWRREGTRALERAAVDPDTPVWLPNLVARFMSEDGEHELAIRHLEQAYASTTNEETRAQIVGKLKQLQAGQTAESMEAAAERFQAAMKNRYPYAPEAFSVVAGPRYRRSFSISGPSPSDDGN